MKKFLKVVAYLVAVHATALLLQALFRLLFLLAVSGQLTDDVRGDISLYATAFVRGLWFDNVIGCYILIVPLAVLCLAAMAGYYGKWLARGAGIFFGVTYTIVFMATAANIPYFAYFTKPLNSSIWNWAEYGTTTLGMMFGESSYYFYIFCFFAFTAAFCGLLRLYGRRLRSALQAGAADQTGTKGKGFPWQRLAMQFLTAAALVGLCLFGIRGRTGYNPIKVSAAYFCTSPVLNQLGVNPVFCLLTSTLDDRRKENRTLHLMDGEQAVARVQQLLGRQGLEEISPIARRIEPDGTPQRKNVVMVFMESLSAKLMARFGGEGLTPCLDSLWRQSIAFSNFYSAGNHTNQGLYATLYSFPTIMKRNAMKGSAIPSYSGLPTVLQAEGYRTMFFMTHESQYDNMNAFFRSNGYEEIYSQENYPRDRRLTHFGVPDDFLFGYALPVLRQAGEAGKPFFATLLTITNHPPYTLPAYYHPQAKDPERQVVEYADWAIARFMEAASKEAWFRNTVFVFLGDHGKMVGQADCELPESYNHVPLMIYGAGLAPQERAGFCGQVDVAPTLLGLLGIPYVQNNFGVDLLREQRPCMFYTADNTVAARDSTCLYVYNPDAGRDFCYRTGSGKPVPAEMDGHFRNLKNYCFSMLQATETLVQQGKTLDHPRKAEKD